MTRHVSRHGVRRRRHAAAPFPSRAVTAVGAIAELADLKKVSSHGTVLPFNLALVHLGLGEHAGALDGLEQAYAANSQMMPWIGRDVMFDPLRSEPRLAALLKQVNLAPLSGGGGQAGGSPISRP